MKTKELSNKRKRLTLFLLTCLVMNFSLHAQVTVGGLTDPAAGAILDLNSTAKGGLLLSNVALTDLTKIPGNYAFAGIATEQDDNTELTGAMVYNTDATTGVGVYLWNGTNWTPMGEDCRGLVSSNIHIAAYPFAKVSTPVSFSASTDATGRCAEGETYTWSVVSGGSNYVISAPTASTTSITFNSVGTYTVQVEVKNCYSAPVTKTISVEVNNDGSLPANALASGYGIVGKTCLDVKQSKQPVSQSDDAFTARVDAFPDAGSYAKTYEFVHGDGYSDLSLFYLDDPVTGIVESITSPPASVAVSGSQSFTVRFKSGVKNLVPSNGDSLTVKLIASYKTAAEPAAIKYAYLEIRVEDGTCVCPAKKSATEWLNFMCHNLGGEDIISSSQLITRAHHGDWYKFGATATSMYNTEAHDSNNSWDNSNYTSSGNWPDDGTPPCPAGWRLPTKGEWTAVMGLTADYSSISDSDCTNASSNAISSVPSASWTGGVFTNFKKVGDYLFLPAAGYRHGSNGALYSRGSCGEYWSSIEESSTTWDLYVGYGYQSMYNTGRTFGFSVRCVAAEF
jgi:uncharacterized protein (TIGR02145 family)